MEDKNLHSRNGIRINKDLKVSFRNAADKGAFYENFTIDISRSGLFIKTSQIYPLNTELEIKLFLEDEDEKDEPLEFIALVSRVVSDTDEELSGLGIKIKNISSNEHQRLEGFMNLLNYYGWFC